MKTFFNVFQNFTLYLLLTFLWVSDANAQTIWNSGSLTFTKTSAGQADAITPQTHLTRVTVLYNDVCQTVSGFQGCTYVGPCNTEWAYGSIANWNTLTYQPLYLENGCSPPSMVGTPIVCHLIAEDIYLQITFSLWQTGGSNFTYTRTTGPTIQCQATLSSAAGTNTQAACINTPITNITYSTTDATGAAFSGLPAGVTGSWASDVITISGTPTATGTFNYTATLTGGSCSTENVTGTITVNALPTVSLGVDTTQCGGSVTLDAGNPGATYAWLPSGSTQSIPAAATGTYSVTVTDANGCIGSDAINVTINTIPVVSISGNAGYCAGDSTLLTGANGGTLQWYLNGTLIPGATADTYTATAPGSYNQVKTNASGCSDSSSTPFIVTENPLPTVSLGSDTTQCGGSVSLNAGNPGATYVWLPSGSTQSIPAAATGTYSVTVTDANGCIGSDAINVTINTIPVVSISGNAGYCAGGSTLLTGANGGTLQWYLNGALIPGATAATYTATAPGSYNQVKTNTSGCSDSAATPFIVTENPLPDISTTLNNITLSSNQNGASYQWIDCGNGNAVIAGETNQSYSATVSGDYAVVVTLNGCSDTSACVQVVVSAVNALTADQQLAVYPNPNKGSFAIKANFEGTYSIVDELGRKVRVFNLNADNNYTINIEEMSNGVYFLIGQSQDIRIHQKIVVLQ